MLIVFDCTLITAPEAFPGITDTLLLGDTLTLNYKDKFVTQANDFWVSFDSVVADSRCPIDVECIWAGNAEIGFSAGTELENRFFVLNTHPYRSRDTIMFFHHISLISVDPYPHSDSLYSASDYSVKIKVE